MNVFLGINPPFFQMYRFMRDILKTLAQVKIN